MFVKDYYNKKYTMSRIPIFLSMSSKFYFINALVKYHPFHPINRLPTFLYNGIYLTLSTFSFEIKESRLSDTRCLIQDVASPHCGDKRTM